EFVVEDVLTHFFDKKDFEALFGKDFKIIFAKRENHPATRNKKMWTVLLQKKMKQIIPLPKISEQKLSEIKNKELELYTKKYYEETYWVEDIPGKKHYREFHYNDPTHEKRFRYL